MYFKILNYNILMRILSKQKKYWKREQSDKMEDLKWTTSQFMFTLYNYF